MTTKIQDQFISTVVSGFYETTQNNTSNYIVMDWVYDSLFNEKSSQQDVDDFAQGILTDFDVSKTNQKRYKFHPLPANEELLKALFDKSFEYEPEAIIAGAQQVDPAQGSFYPLWKRVLLIYLPKTTAAILGNSLVKIAIGIAACYFSYSLGSKASHAMIHFFRARAIPFIINNTPIKVIRGGNAIMDAKDWIFNRLIVLLLGAYITQQIVRRGPEIPYITAAARSIDIWDIWRFVRPSPSSLLGFVVSTSWNTVVFVSQSCSTASGFFSYSAMQAENERLAICQAKAYAVWKQSMQECIPTKRVDSR